MTPPNAEISDLIAEMQSEVAQVQSEAASEVSEAADAVADMGSEKARLWVTFAVLAIFAVALLGYGLWAAFGDAAGFICADQAAAAAKTCSGRWVETKGVLESIVTTAVLPLVTLVLGYYFGKAPETDA